MIRVYKYQVETVIAGPDVYPILDNKTYIGFVAVPVDAIAIGRAGARARDLVHARMCSEYPGHPDRLHQLPGRLDHLFDAIDLALSDTTPFGYRTALNNLYQALLERGNTAANTVEVSATHVIVRTQMLRHARLLARIGEYVHVIGHEALTRFQDRHSAAGADQSDALIVSIAPKERP